MFNNNNLNDARIAINKSKTKMLVMLNGHMSIDELNHFNKIVELSTSETKITIMVNSGGGSINAIGYLIKILDITDYKSINIITLDFIGSSATSFICKALHKLKNVTLTITNGTEVMQHSAGFGGDDKSAKHLLSGRYVLNEFGADADLERQKIFFTDDEIARIKEGDNVNIFPNEESRKAMILSFNETDIALNNHNQIVFDD